MKKIKLFLIGIAIVGIIVVVIGGAFWINFHLWRAEHPQAKTWTYFIHARR